MIKVKITETNHPRINVGYLYLYENTTTGFRLTSLGGKHSVHFTHDCGYGVKYTPVKGSFSVPTPNPEFNTEPHVRIGERIAADLWREAYVAGDETVEVCDWVAVEFLKRWKEGFFRGEAKA